MPDADVLIDEAIDARAAGLGPADLIFVFGTRLPEPAHRAADLFERRLAPYIVVTGGAGRQLDGLNEADHHRDLLVGAGVPAERIIVENRSTHTLENILFAVPLINQRIPNPRIVTAVVKRSHRRALVLLARHMPTIERIYAVDYLVTEVFSKDSWRCRYCGLRVIQPAVARRLRHALAELVPWGPTNDDKHAALMILRASPDHVVPRSSRGTDDAANLVTACYPCQFKKADSTLAKLGLYDPRGYEVDKSTDWDGLADRSIKVAPAVEASSSTGGTRGWARSRRDEVSTPVVWLG